MPCQLAEAGRGWPRLAEAGRGWPRLGAALSLILRWRGVLEGELADASGRLCRTWLGLEFGFGFGFGFVSVGAAHVEHEL